MAANYNSKLILTMLLYIIYFIVVYDVIEYNCNIWTDRSMTWTIFNERPLYETINKIDIYLHILKRFYHIFRMVSPCNIL